MEPQLMPYLSFGQATNDAMRVVMREDERVIVLGEDIRWGGSFGQFRGLYDEFGDRVIDMPISEAIIVAVCVGAASTGMRPVASMSFVEFALGAMDELVNQAAKFRYMFGAQTSVPMVLRAADGTIRSAAAQHSESIEALFAHIPGLKVVAPSTPYDAKGLLIAAIADDNPVVYLENKKIQPLKGEVPEGLYEVPLGQAAVRRQGRDVTIIAYSVQAINGADACEELAREGIEAELIDLRTLVPLDFETIADSVRKTHRAIVCHEAWTASGFGAEVAARIQEELFDELDAPVGRVGAKNAHIPFAPVLERAVVPATEEITAAARAVAGRPARARAGVL
jgi:pyruvate dehydrogenase E1 component beta subunit